MKKITNKAVKELLINAGLDQAIYRNAKKQTPENAGFRLEAYKNEYYDRLYIYAATTTWNDLDTRDEIIHLIKRALVSVGISYQADAEKVVITR